MVRFFRAVLLTACALAPASALAQKPTPTPRVLVRLPFGVPAAKHDEVVAKVAAAVKEAGALSIKQQDFANAAGGRAEVKTILQSARENLTQASGHLGAKRYDAAISSLQKSIADYESIGSDLWRTSELAYVYLKLGLTRWQKDGKKMSPQTVEAFRRAKTLDPALDLIEFEDDEIAAFKKGSAGATSIPPPPGEGFYSLARVMGLDGLVEVRVDPKGIYQLRVHRISPVNVKSFKMASKAAGLDVNARKQLRALFAFDATAVASASPAPTVVAVAPTPVPERTVSWESSVTPTPTPEVIATPTPAPTAVAVASPPTNGNGVRNGNGRTPPRPTPTPDIEDEPPTQPPVLAGGADRWAALTTGVDRRYAVYAGTAAATAVPSGYGGSVQLRSWFGFARKWAVAAHGGAMQRSYLVSEENDTVKSAMGIDAGAYLLRSDDADGTWWIGGGAGYVSEPGIKDPGGSVPSVTRVTPAIVGQMQLRPGTKLVLRLRGTAGVGLEMGTGGDFGDGVGYDVVGEASAAYTLTKRLKLAAGVSGRRIYTEFAEKQNAVEARQSAWLGIEAGF